MHRLTWLAGLWLALSALVPACAQLKLAMPFQDHMVLQQGTPVPVWGTAKAAATVTVQCAGQRVTATADKDGRWLATLAPLKGSLTPIELTAASEAQTLTLRDVLVGEVWLCSGQSNMEWRVKDTRNADAEKAAAQFPAIRMLTSGQNRWIVCAPDTVGDFSAVGFFFARTLHTRLHVPVGMLNASMGGTMIQPWMTPASARAVPALQGYWKDVDAQMAAYAADRAAYTQRYQQASADLPKAQEAWEGQALAADPGLAGRWFDPALDAQAWTPVTLPMPDADAALNDVGTVWLRATVEIPQAWVGKALTLHLGPIDEMDTTYVNGTQVGRTWRDTKDFWRVPRQYTVPAAANTTPRLTVTLCVYNLIGMMGLFGTPEQWAVRLADDPAAPPVSLATTWRMRAGQAMDLATRPTVPLLATPTAAAGFGWLYQPKIAPLVPYAIKGALWYQGESNAFEPRMYATLVPSLVTGWRQAWGQGDFAFYYVSLAGHQGRQRLPIERNSWAELRDAQRAALTLPRTGEVVATDIGDAADIHPRNKQEVGRRLALWALAKEYGQRDEFSGPTVRGVRVKGDTIIVTFDHAKGLRLAGDTRVGFAVAGADKVFHHAVARVKGATLVLKAADSLVPAPVAVRYGWAFHPACFLYNAAGLPASPFRTDTWDARDVRSYP
jgi:sialate O-acetylesterase